jgi:periplasmic protein TonB
MTARTPMAGKPVAAGPEIGWVIGGSALLHGVILTILLWQAAPLPAEPPAEGATVQVEYIHQTATTKGVANPDATAIPTDDPASGAAPAVAAPPPPSNPYADVPMPPAAPTSEAAAYDTGHPTTDPGTGEIDRDALTVTGDNVVSSGPDAAFRNLPPNYPREAVRQHQQGSVQVSVHITPDGMADDVQTLISSGSSALDDAVRDAVLKWHFKPAMRDGVAVASVYKLQMNFRTQTGP